MLNFLIDGGLDVNIKSNIIYADVTLSKYEEMYDVGLDRYILFNSHLYYTALHKAAIEGNFHYVQLLIKLGADINAMDITDTTPVYYAAFCQKPQIVEYLLACGADVNFNPESFKARVVLELVDNPEILYTRNIILKHAVKLNVFNMLKDKAILEFVGDNLIEFENECKCEANVMKNTTITSIHSVTYADLLTKSNNCIINYLRNDEIRRELKDNRQEVLQQLPNYCQMLDFRLEKFIPKAELVNTSYEVLSSILNNAAVFPVLCVEKVLSFLNEVDMKTLKQMKMEKRKLDSQMQKRAKRKH